jgi:hypothetical protein
MAEQRRVNSEMGASLGRQTSLVEALDERLDRLNHRLASYTGGLAALWLVFQVVSRTLLR